MWVDKALEWFGPIRVEAKRMLDKSMASKNHDMANMTNGAYELANAGGKHHNGYREQQKNGIRQIRKGIASFEKRIAEHHEWIENPSLKVENWENRDIRYQAGLLKRWRNDIERHHEFIDILRGVL